MSTVTKETSCPAILIHSQITNYKKGVAVFHSGLRPAVTDSYIPQAQGGDGSEMSTAARHTYSLLLYLTYLTPNYNFFFQPHLCVLISSEPVMGF